MQSCVNSYSVVAVDLHPYNGPFWFGGHRGGTAGQILNYSVGDLVQVSGAGAGTYSITGSTWIGRDNDSRNDYSKLGNGIVFQTCGDS